MSNDAEELRNAIKGFGTNEDALIKIVANRSNAQRQAIKTQYKASFGRDLIEDLKSDLHGKFEDAMIALFSDPIEYDCQELRVAMKGLGTDEDTLIEIIASRTPQIIGLIKQKYQELYQRDLEKDVKKETSGTLQKLLVSLLQGGRSTNLYPDMNRCAQIAKELYDAGEAKFGTDESIFNKYMVLLSPYEIAAVNQEYGKITGHNIIKAIEKEFSGKSKKAYLAVVNATTYPSKYFATRVKDAIKGLGTKDHLLIRILISRSEIDMPQIKQCYKELYNKDMVEDIKSDISGDYRKLMLELLSH